MIDKCTPGTVFCYVIKKYWVNVTFILINVDSLLCIHLPVILVAKHCACTKLAMFKYISYTVIPSLLRTLKIWNACHHSWCDDWLTKPN